MRRGHYLARDTVFGLPLVALALNIVLLSMAIVQLRASKGALRVVVSGAEAAAVTALSSHAGGAVPLLVISANSAPKIDGRAMETPLDLEFRLAALATAGAAIRIQVEPDAGSARLAEAMSACARAGLTQVMVETTVHEQPPSQMTAPPPNPSLP